MSDLAAFHARAWDLLAAGLRDKTSPARHPTLATVSPEGLPEARTVVLRALDRDDATLEIHSDTQTAKIRAIKAAPVAALHIWWPKEQLQLRMIADVEVLEGSKIESRWDNVPSMSRSGYGADPVPGTPIAMPGEEARPGAAARFAALILRVQKTDALLLSSPHKRAIFQRSDNWAGGWVVP